MPTSLTPGPLLEALYALWDRLRTLAPADDLPASVHIALITTTPSSDHGQRRWGTTPDGTLTGLAVSTRVLDRGGQATAEHLLHEAAHILCWQRGVNDTAGRGTYHTAEYLAAAEEVGLHWGDRPRAQNGWPDPSISDRATEELRAEIKRLDDVIPQVLPALTPPTPAASKRPGRLAMTCQCEPEPRKMWMSRTVADRGPVLCGVCSEPFEFRG